jgi:hypothetical protein
MGGFWPRIYVIKKGHARDIHFLLQTRNFWHFSAPPLLSLYVLRAAIYSPVPFIGCIGSSHMKLRSDRSTDLRSLRWYSTQRLAPGVGYMRIVHRVAQGKIFAFVPEMEELVRRGPDWRTAGSREANKQEAPLPDRHIQQCCWTKSGNLAVATALVDLSETGLISWFNSCAATHALARMSCANKVSSSYPRRPSSVHIYNHLKLPHHTFLPRIRRAWRVLIATGPLPFALGAMCGPPVNKAQRPISRAKSPWT